MNELKITSKNGKVYNSIRAYHIALGHIVRQALIDFAKEIVELCQNQIIDFYGEYTPEYYTRTNQLLTKMQLGQLIKTEIKGAFEKERASFIIDVFDWSALEPSYNGYGEFGTYTDFYGNDSRESIEEILSNGIYGHTGLELKDFIKKYIESNLDEIIEKAINSL